MGVFSSIRKLFGGTTAPKTYYALPAPEEQRPVGMPMTMVQILPTVEELEKAQRGGGTEASYATPEEAARAHVFDPRDAAGSSVYGYIEPQQFGAFDFSMLRRLSRVPPVAAIIQTRLNQLAQFARPQATEYQPGFRVKLRETKRSPSKIEQKELLAWVR